MKSAALFFSLFVGLIVAPALSAATIEQALADNARPEKDRDVDAMRKPGEVLSFLDIEEGMAVLDVFGGGGFYTEIVSRIVGADGFVTLYNNGAWDKLVGKNVQTRLANNRLPNVDYLVELPFNLNMDEEYDAALFILGMHDLYYEDKENGWRAIDVDTFLGNIYRALKPGAVLGIVDHNARAGSDPAVSGKELHRIDPAIIKRDLEAAGFAFEGEADLLRNPADELTKLVFDPEIRRKTDRSVMKFRKPAN